MVCFVMARLASGATVPVIQLCELEFAKQWVRDKYRTWQGRDSIRDTIKANARLLKAGPPRETAIILYKHGLDGFLDSATVFDVEKDKLVESATSTPNSKAFKKQQSA